MSMSVDDWRPWISKRRSKHALSWESVRKNKEYRDAIYRRDNWCCVYCLSYGEDLQLDHIVPRSKGGGNEPSNLVTSCKSCNCSKNNSDLSEWGSIAQQVRALLWSAQEIQRDE